MWASTSLAFQPSLDSGASSGTLSASCRSRSDAARRRSEVALTSHTRISSKNPGRSAAVKAADSVCMAKFCTKPGIRGPPPVSVLPRLVAPQVVVDLPLGDLAVVLAPFQGLGGAAELHHLPTEGVDQDVVGLKRLEGRMQ